jgi:hypothetical protein
MLQKTPIPGVRVYTEAIMYRIDGELAFFMAKNVIFRGD